MTKINERRSKLSTAGFTVVELLVYLIIAVIVVGGAFQLLIGQNRLYIKQRELEDVRSSLRAAANILAFELRQASAFGDPYFISTDSFAIRSLQGSGIVCSKHSSAPRVGLWGTAGEFYATSEDSVLVYAAASWGISDDSWVPGEVSQLWGSPSAGGVPSCDWGGGAQPDLVLELAGSATPPDQASGDLTITALGPVYPGATVEFAVSHPLLSCEDFYGDIELDIEAGSWEYEGSMSGCTFTITIPGNADELEIEIEAEDLPYIDEAEADYRWDFNGGGSAQDSILNPVHVGAPLRAFRRVQYGIFEEDGRWWLGRKVGSATQYEKVMGPLESPTDDGLVLTFYDAAGVPTTDPTRVETIDISLRGMSFGKVRKGSTLPPDVVRDSLTIRVTLRG